MFGTSKFVQIIISSEHKLKQMNNKLNVLFTILVVAFTMSIGNAQSPHGIREVFLSLPDSVFNTIKELNFAEGEPFPLDERERMFTIYDAKKRLKDSLDPRFKITFLNETNNLLRASNGEFTMNIKLWKVSNDEYYLVVDGEFQDDWIIQTVKFYSFKGGRLKPIHPLPESYPVTQFFDTHYVEAMKLDEDYPVPNVLIEFSPKTDDIRVRLQPEIFDEDLIGSKGQPITKLDCSRKKYEWLIYYFKEGGKFEVPSKALNVKY
jgi:hypothetical protein